MKVKIPHELRMKFINKEGLINVKDTLESIPGFKQAISSDNQYKVVLDLTNYSESLQACERWHGIIITFFRYSYSAFRLNIGPYEGIFPSEIVNNKVFFNIDYVHADFKLGWEDWFIKKDIEYSIGPLL